MSNSIRLGLAILLVLPIHFLYGQTDRSKLITVVDQSPAWQFNDPSLSEYGVLQAAEVLLNPFSEAVEIDLNLFEGYEFTALFDRKEVHPSGAEIWVGHLHNEPLSYIILSTVEGITWGKLQTQNGEIFLIKPIAASTRYQLIQIAPGHLGNEDCQLEKTLPPPVDSIGGGNATEKVVGVCDAGSTCSAITLDLLIVYTPAAKTALGGTDAAAQAAIALAVAELNTVCANSGVTHDYALAHTEEVSYTESGSFSTDLDHLEDAADGVIDEVYDMRDYYYADLVAMVLENGGCGLGNVNVDPSTYYSSAAFSVVRDDCMTGNLSLSHEFGHNMGFRHDRYAYSSIPSNVCDYAWGWVNPGAFTGGSSERWRTVMAYNAECFDAGFNCTRIPHWSNPAVNYNGDPTGSTIGSADEANNGYLLDRSACLVDEFRVPVSCTGGCMFFQGAANYNLNTASGPGNTTDVVLNETFPTLTGGSGTAELCVYYHGDHSFASETFNVRDENSNILGQTVASNDCIIPNRVCFNIPAATYNSWIADNSITISLDPTSTQINPTYVVDIIEPPSNYSSPLPYYPLN